MELATQTLLLGKMMAFDLCQSRGSDVEELNAKLDELATSLKTALQTNIGFLVQFIFFSLYNTCLCCFYLCGWWLFFFSFGANSIIGSFNLFIAPICKLDGLEASLTKKK